MQPATSGVAHAVIIRPIAATEVSAIRNFGFVLLLAFLFMIFSRVFDVKFSQLHAPGISYRIMAVIMVLTGAFVTAFRSKIGKNFLRFTICMILSIAFSMWRAGSLHVFLDQWLMGTVVFVSTAGVISDFRQYRQTIASLALAIFVLALICLKFGDMSTGRLSLETGRFSNPNEMAQAFIIGLPFWLFLVPRSSSLFKKLFGIGAVALILYLTSKTGSRGALFSIAVLYLVMIHHASALGKLKLVLAGALVVTAALALLPSSLKERYHTLFNEERPDAQAAVNAEMVDRAVASAESRQHLLKQSLKITAEHPVFGVGPGMFMDEEDRLAKTEGKRKGSWLGTHNSYTQVSSECGIPAFIFYMATLFLALKSARSVYKAAKIRPELKEVCSHAEALYFSLIGFAVTAMFVHAAYSALMPVLAGLAAALARTAQPLIDQAPAIAQTPAPVRIPAGLRLPVAVRTA